jgi:hypothetical protein
MNFESKKDNSLEEIEVEDPSLKAREQEHSLEDFEEEMKKRGIELYGDTEDAIKKAEHLIVGQFNLDKEDLVDKLEMADFSEDEIEQFSRAAQAEGLEEFLSEKLKEEKEYLSKKLNNPEFIRGLDTSITALKDFVDSIGLTEVIEKRWPKVMYAGKIGRMIIRSNKIEVFDTHCLAGGEYAHEDTTSYMFLSSDVGIPAGKAVLETQIHETIHGISKNEISDENGLQINRSGFGELQFNPEEPLQSKDQMRSFNESVTEYFARKFCKNSFVSEPRTEHEYDPLVKNITSLIDRLGVHLGKDRTDMEKEIFSAYINGDTDSFIDLTRNVLGRFAPQILGRFFSSLDGFLPAYALHALGASQKEKVTLDFENVEKTGVNMQEFREEYPFVRLIKYDFDPVTFEPIEKEI